MYIYKPIYYIQNDEATVLEADSILKALGVEAEEDIQNLLQYFFRDEDGDVSDDEDEAMAMLQVFFSSYYKGEEGDGVSFGM
jgi:hypothetical protein